MYSFEIGWQGVRALVHGKGGRVHLESATLDDITAYYPELRALGRSLGSREILLDGVLVALAGDGRPSRERLERRRQAASEAAARRLSSQIPATFMIFDALYLDGHPTMPLSYADRRRVLDELALGGEAWQTPSSQRGPAESLLRAAATRGLAGLVAKRVDSPYTPGQRSDAWLELRSEDLPRAGGP